MRLIPWLHYIPLSMSMAEMPSMLQFLLDHGDDVLASVAKNGKDWANTALRPVDAKIYMYRLLLEMGRRTYPSSK